MNAMTKVAGALLATTVGLTSITALTSPAEAAPPGRINGFVSAAGGGPLAGIYVSTLRWNEGAGAWHEVDSAFSSVDGRYSVGKLETGTYRVRYYDPSGAYATEFYKDVSRAADAQPIDVSVGKFDAEPTELGGAAHLTGRVTGTDGLGIVDAAVTAYVRQDDLWVPFQAVTAGADGSYDLGGLPGGEYTLGFSDPASGVGEYWNDQVALEVAHTLTVQSSGTTDGLNAELATTGTQESTTGTDTGTDTTGTDTTGTDTTGTDTTGTTDTTSTTSGTLTGATTTTSTTTSATTGKIVMIKKPKIKGIAKVNRRLRVTKGAWNPTNPKRKIQWLANGKKIKGATKMRLRLTRKLVGKKIRVKVTVVAPGMAKLTVKTKATKKVKR